MNINIKALDSVKVVELIGDIDTKTAPSITEQVLVLVQPGSKLLIDMNQVDYMSSAGLRMLLSLSQR